MCLFRYPLEFGAGAALRSVTDWRAYSPEYTRPLLGGGPNDVPEVYKRCSPIDHADQLARPLLLLHGLMDDNVFAQDTLRLVEALQKAGKTDLFELMLYPSQNHAFTSSHSWVDEYQRIESFFEEHLAEARRE
jgi:dipeptidyl aminopeptidase/acylaminoacyl peptidase